MTVRRRRAVITVLAVTAAAVLGACSSPGGSQPTTPIGPQSRAQSDPAVPSDLTEAQATVLAAAQDVVDAHPDVLGSAFFDPATSAVVVRRAPGVTDAAARTALATSAQPGVATLTIVPGRRSAAEIDDALSEALELHLPDGSRPFSAGYDEHADTVQVAVQDPSPPVEAAVRAALGEFAVVVAGTPIGSNAADADLDQFFIPARRHGRSPFAGGSAFAIKNQGADDVTGGCTTGFSWRGPAGEQWMTTAGHCFAINQAQQRAFTRNRAASSPFWTVPLGRAIATSYESGVGTFALKGAQRGDIAVLLVQPGSTSGPRILIGGKGSAQKHDVIGTTTRRPVKGDKLCVSGARTGERCGFTVTSAKTAYTNGGFLGLVGGAKIQAVTAARGSTPCPDSGDSGAPVYIKTATGDVIAKGIYSGGGTNPMGTVCEVLFTPIQSVTAAWGGRIAQV